MYETLIQSLQYPDSLPRWVLDEEIEQGSEDDSNFYDIIIYQGNEFEVVGKRYKGGRHILSAFGRLGDMWDDLRRFMRENPKSKFTYEERQPFMTLTSQTRPGFGYRWNFLSYMRVPEALRERFGDIPRNREARERFVEMLNGSLLEGKSPLRESFEDVLSVDLL